MLEKRYFRYFDWINFSLTLILLSIGLLFIFSSTYKPEKPFSIFFKKQLCGIISGLLIYLFFSIKDIRFLNKIGYFLYFIILGMLIYTIINGWIVMGAKRWIPLYFFRFQPSELTKLFLPVFIAHYFEKQNPKKLKPTLHKIKFKKFIFPLSILLISIFFILKQPDLGTAIVILLSGFILFWFIGINKKFFIIFGLIIFISTPFLWTFLKPYQKQRILVLLGYGDAKKERYQLIQSKIAIGSGGIIGKGLLKGTQNKLDFLPENHTDFIFSVICEESGFIGALIILFLFCILFTRIIFIIIQLTNFFEQIISLGLLSHLMLSMCINVGMGIGILPIVGIPLPLFSYGITNLWITLASLGWLNNIAIRRFYY
ncbi:rod shape-determining protein RodA [Candidatus Babeliales bacterium]|nr:rod shape-determining protein RodA [Candidatus Babeliales bacterium]